jgi:hypothetical protein
MKRYEACSYIADSAKEASNKFREDCAKEKGGYSRHDKKRNKTYNSDLGSTHKN